MLGFSPTLQSQIAEMLFKPWTTLGMSSYHGGDCSLALHLPSVCAVLVKSEVSTLLLTMTRLFLTPSCSPTALFPRWRNYCLLKYCHPFTFSLPICHEAHLSAACTYHSLSKLRCFSIFPNYPCSFSHLTLPAAPKTTPFQTPQHPKVPSVPSSPTEHHIPAPTKLVHFSLETESKIKILHLTQQSKPGLLFLSFLEEERIELADQRVFENISLWTSVRSIKLLHLLQKSELQSLHRSRIIQPYQSFHTNTCIILKILIPSSYLKILKIFPLSQLTLVVYTHPNPCPEQHDQKKPKLRRCCWETNQEICSNLHSFLVYVQSK